MTIVVAPITLFNPDYVVQENVFGDTDGSLSSGARAQTFIFLASDVFVAGDANTLSGRGAADTFNVTGIAFGTALAGDAVYMIDGARGGADKVTVSGGIEAWGDAGAMFDSIGGDDTIVARNGARVAGEAREMYGTSRGGNDRMTIYVSNELAVGDADSLNDTSRGGNDWLIGRISRAVLAGDAEEMLSSTRGGNDTIVAEKFNSFLYGDAGAMYEYSIGGRDILTAKGSLSTLVGDADFMAGYAKGSNDRLTGSSGQDWLYGDARFLDENASCGNDVLNGGRGNDYLYGDAENIFTTGTRGNDRFVFNTISGKDTIGDFEQGRDLIDVSRLGYQRLGQLTIDVVGSDSIVHFQGTNQVTIEDISHLRASDFLFA